jgi:hypothetical protein
MDYLLIEALRESRNEARADLVEFYETRVEAHPTNTPSDFALKLLLASILKWPLAPRIRFPMIEILQHVSAMMQFLNADEQPRYIILDLLRFAPTLLLIDASEAFAALIRALEELRPYISRCDAHDQALWSHVLELLHEVPPDADVAHKLHAIRAASRAHE